ncbi:unnamed protein product [Rangifer tarandus platyrhynchus]|uniref:Uncharacterized protein n=1 Tax=Rangifer tarandus platyrhynchus TaxID=3082113 RepID=A0AC59ZVZ8_RANTA
MAACCHERPCPDLTFMLPRAGVTDPSVCVHLSACGSCQHLAAGNGGLGKNELAGPVCFDASKRRSLKNAAMPEQASEG